MLAVFNSSPTRPVFMCLRQEQNRFADDEQCSKDVKHILLNSKILAQKGYLSLLNYGRIGFSL